MASVSSWLVWCASLAFATGALGSWVQQRWGMAATPEAPRMVSLDVAGLLAAMARSAAPGQGMEEEHATWLVHALQVELQALSQDEIVVLNAAAVVAGVEDLTPRLQARLLSAAPPHVSGAR